MFITNLLNLVVVLLVLLPMLISVAYITIAERKIMGSMQRRLGPNAVGIWGLLQPFSDALKLIVKETIIPSHANKILFFLGPLITLIFALLGWATIPFAPGCLIFDFNLGILYSLAISSLGVYGLLIGGWAANSKYAFLGSIRSTAQLISYELVLTSTILVIILLSGTLNITEIIEYQKPIWFGLPLFPLLLIFLIGALAETNRHPADLTEAESELVAGGLTEKSATLFVFLFLAEYSNIILMSTFTSIFFMGGYLLNIPFWSDLFGIITYILGLSLDINMPHFAAFMSHKCIFIVQALLSGLTLGIKASIIIFIFIWVWASFPRVRFDQLMSFCWTVLLPIIFAFIIFIPCLLITFEINPSILSPLIYLFKRSTFLIILLASRAGSPVAYIIYY